jgi:serine/threonine-protein kinase HipA
MMAFTVAIGNTDAHLRNHSFLHGAGKISLAPIYDAAPTANFVSGRQLALWVDDQALLGIITRKQLVREIVSWGLTAEVAENVVDATLTGLITAYPLAAEVVPQVPGAIADSCRLRTENLLRQR